MAAGYALYSSAVMLVLSWGAGVHGFTLDTGMGGFVLTHPDMRMPQRGTSASIDAPLCADISTLSLSPKEMQCWCYTRLPRPHRAQKASKTRLKGLCGKCAGQIYSVNDARYFDWPAGLRQYIDDIRQGRGQNPKQYSARYVCSLVRHGHSVFLASMTLHEASVLRSPALCGIVRMM